MQLQIRNEGFGFLGADDDRTPPQEAESESSPVLGSVDLADALTFSNSPELELKFKQEFAKEQRLGDFVLAVPIRLVGWLTTSYKVYKRGEPALAVELLLLCLPISLLPVIGMVDSHFYIKYRIWLVAITNGIQYIQTSIQYYGQLYYSPEGSSATYLQLISAILTANGVAWLVMTGLLGSLPFKYGFLVQAMYGLILVVGNSSMCHTSTALKNAYTFLSNRMVKHVLGSQFPLFVGKEEEVCIFYQTLLQFLFGICLTCAVAYQRELTQRKVFLHRQNVRYDARYPSLTTYFYFLMPVVLLPWAGILTIQLLRVVNS